MLKNAKYIICDENKIPKHSLDAFKSLSDVKDEPNLGILLEEPYLIVDIDDETEFDVVCKIVKRYGIKTKILKTSRGGHFWFKSAIPVKNVVHSNTPLTVTIDIKSWGRKTMEIVKKDGEWREWLQDDNTVDELPFFLTPMNLTKNFYGMTEGDGRNDALFTTIIPLVKQGITKDQTRQLFYMINEYMFAEPLNYNEIDAMIEDNEIFKSKTVQFYNGATFQHDVFADYMIEKYNIKYYGKSLYIYDGRAYISDDELIKAKMVEVIPHLKTNNLREAFENIKYKVLMHPAKIDTRYANLENGLVDLEHYDIIPHTSKIFTINKIPVKYNPDAKSDVVDRTLNSLCCDRQELVNLLYEMIGYVLIPDCRYQKAFILLGNGSNGKSVLLETIREMIGDENCSSLALEDLADKFRSSEIVGKMVNIGDDSGHSLLENTAIFKKLVTGDNMTFERKRQDPFKYSNTAKLIFAANSLPPTTDKSDGFFRRCIIIPFEATFRPGEANYDPAIICKMTTPEAKSHLFNLALAGLKQLNDDQYFNESNDTKILTKTYMTNNNSVFAWMTDKPTTYTSLAEAYVAYVGYCTSNGYKPCNMGKFSGEYDRAKKMTK